MKPKPKTKIIYGKILTCGELRHQLDPVRDDDGIARKVLVRRCLITECPGGSMDMVMDYIKIADSRFTKNYFTSRTYAEYKKNPDPGVDLNWYSK